MFGASSFVRALREAAPGLTKRYFTCQCGSFSRAAKQDILRPSTGSHLSTQVNARATSFRPREKPIKSSFSVLRSFATFSRRCSAEALHSTKGAPKKSRFPPSSSNMVAYWLLGSAASVYGIVVFGGLTRLTESGYGPPYLLQLHEAYDIQTLNNRMEARHGHPPTHVGGRLGR